MPPSARSCHDRPALGRARLLAGLVGLTLAAAGACPAALAAPSPRAAAHAPAPDTATPTSPDDDLDLRWNEAVAQAEAAQADYSASETRLTAALDRLARAFTLATGADRSADDAAARLAQTQAARGRLVRGIYAAGGPSALLAAVVASPDPETALYRIAADRRLLAVALAVSARRLDGTRGDAAAARRKQELAQEDADHAAELLELVRGEGMQAEESLRRAQHLVDDLSRQRRVRAEEQARARREAQALAARLAAARAAAVAARAAAVTSVSAAGIPQAYLLDYHAAADTCAGMDWTLLAGVGQVESGHGRNNGPSSAGAIGPMQFMPATFASYAVDGNGDGVTDAWNPTDAIFTAAAYLCATGAGQGPDGVHRALLAYNHAEWYVQLVLAAQSAIAARFA